MIGRSQNCVVSSRWPSFDNNRDWHAIIPIRIKNTTKPTEDKRKASSMAVHRQAESNKNNSTQKKKNDSSASTQKKSDSDISNGEEEHKIVRLSYQDDPRPRNSLDTISNYHKFLVLPPLAEEEDLVGLQFLSSKDAPLSDDWDALSLDTDDGYIDGYDADTPKCAIPRSPSSTTMVVSPMSCSSNEVSTRWDILRVYTISWHFIWRNVPLD